MLPLSIRTSTRLSVAMPTTCASATIAACALSAHSTGVRRVKYPGFEATCYIVPRLEDRADRGGGEVEETGWEDTEVEDRGGGKDNRGAGDLRHGWEARHRFARRSHVHHDDDAQIEEDGDDARQDADDREAGVAGLDGGAEDIPLRDEAGHRREATEREHENRHQRGERRVIVPQARIVADLVVRSIVILEQHDNAEGAEVRQRV